METLQLDQTVYSVAAETFESLAMMFLVTEDEAPAPAPGERAVEVVFTGPFDGSVVLVAAESLLGELASNMLGLEPGLPADAPSQADALKELANVICGNLLPAVAGSKAVFHINAPQILCGWREDCASRGSAAGEARLHTEAGALDVKFYMDAHATGAARADQ